MSTIVTRSEFVLFLTRKLRKRRRNTSTVPRRITDAPTSTFPTMSIVLPVLASSASVGVGPVVEVARTTPVELRVNHVTALRAWPVADVPVNSRW